MTLKFTVGSYLCYMKEFVINGVKADEYDFGTPGDASPETAEEYGCGDMCFTRKPSEPEVLAKYGIDETGYAEICEKLEEALSFGRCDWCV